MSDLQEATAVPSTALLVNADDGLEAYGDHTDIGRVVNKDKKCMSEHGQKLFNAINILLDDQEQLELTQSLFKYQSEHNVFTLVRSCRELFDTPRKKSLMLFMRPVIPVKDRFHYDEYYKLFFPEEFPADVQSIFRDLIPQELLDKTIMRAIERNKQKLGTLEKEKEREQEKRVAAIKMLEQVNFDLNLDIQRLMAKANLDGDDTSEEAAVTETVLPKIEGTENSGEVVVEQQRKEPIKIAGFRIIDIQPDENESLGFDICMGPTNTFIMISYVEPGSTVAKFGMRVGDELVSVNDTSFKMMELDQAIEVCEFYKSKNLRESFLLIIYRKPPNRKNSDLCHCIYFKIRVFSMFPIYAMT
jgi:hypothetical protein